MPIATGMAPLLLVLLAAGVQVLSRFRGSAAGHWLAVATAVTGLLWLALQLGITHTGYGRWVLAALLSCLLGDLVLATEREELFLWVLSLGLGGHLLYGIAFAHLGDNLPALVAGSPMALGLLVGVSRWLAPKLAESHKIPVAIYMLVATAMLLSACLTAGQPAGALVLGGAAGLVLSDLAVARQRFVRHAPQNALWGTPLYYAAQVALVGSTAV